MDGKVYTGCKPLYEAKKFKDFKELINNTRDKYSNRPAFRFKTKEKGVFEDMLYSEYIDKIYALGTALISLGLKDKRIAVISENRYEWQETYLAVVGGTGIIVPFDKSLPEEELLSLIERSECEAIVYSKHYDLIMEKVRNEHIGKIKIYISMDEEKSNDDVKSFKEVEELGKSLLKNGAKQFIEAEINPEEMGIMLFTSGTTSQSKAVVLSQKNILTNIYDITSVFDCNENDVFLSFLPLHHTFECSVGFIYPFSTGGCITFSEGLRHIAENIKEYQITCMISVPALFEAVYKRVIQGIEKQGKASKVKMGRIIGKILAKVGIDVRRTLFKDILDNFGGKLRLCVMGGAAFDPEVEKGFSDFGIEIYQGYGLTETSPVIAAEHKTCYRPGSIGQLFPSIEGKIVDKNELGIGELAVKADSVMLGYYNAPEATKEVFTEDGYFLTGDLGYFDKDGYIFLTGRKKNVIVLKNGKNIFPEEIEALINKIPGVKECMVYGAPSNDDENDLLVSAKIVYDKSLAQNVFGTEDVEEIKEKIWVQIKEDVNQKMPTYKYVKNIIVTDEELIKTTTQKVKRFEEMKKIQNN